MPEKLHRQLAAEAHKKGLTGDHFNKYVYGGLHALGYRPAKKKKSKRRQSRK